MKLKFEWEKSNILFILMVLGISYCVTIGLVLLGNFFVSKIEPDVSFWQQLRLYEHIFGCYASAVMCFFAPIYIFFDEIKGVFRSRKRKTQE